MLLLMTCEQALDFILVCQGILQARFQIVSFVDLKRIEIVASIFERFVNRSHEGLTQIDRMSFAVTLPCLLLLFGRRLGCSGFALMFHALSERGYSILCHWLQSFP